MGVRGQVGVLSGAAALGLALSLACSSGSTFTCVGDDDCSGGVCAGEHCAFPDDGCESNLRYGDFSGPLAGLCVLPDDATGGPTSATSGVSATATSTSMGDVTVTDTGPVADDGTDTDGPPEILTLFLDDDAGDFGGGTLDGVVYERGQLRLADVGMSGTFTSRVFDAGGDVQWTDLSWMPDAPYAKPLPDGGGEEPGYETLGISMADNVLLMHFEDSAPLRPGATVIDDSGLENHGVIAGTVATDIDPGVFGGALVDPVDAYVSIPTANGSFDAGSNGFTWSIWFRISHGCETNNVFMGIEEVIGGGDLEEHLWMGCSDDAWAECPRATNEAHSGGVLRSQHAGAGDGASFCSAVPINDGQWHHMAVIKDGHDNATVSHWVDGALVQQQAATFLQEIELGAAPDFAIGGFSEGTYPTSGELDEAAVWNRALTDDEARGLFVRGAAELSLEVRICTQADCADDPPFRGGPDLVAGQRFTDPANATGPGSVLDVSGFQPGRWVQYRVTMSALSGARPPGLTSVQISGVVD